MFDHISFILITFFTVLAFIRGFIKEILGVAGMITVVAATFFAYKNLGLISFGYNDIISQSLIMLSVFTLSIIIFGMINNKLLKLLEPIRLSSVDRFCGAIFGFTKGLLFCFILFLFVYAGSVVLSTDTDVEGSAEEDLPNFIKKSRIYPIMLNVFECTDSLIKIDWDVVKRKSILFHGSMKRQSDSMNDDSTKNEKGGSTKK